MSRRRGELINPAAALDANPRQRKVLYIHGFLAGFTGLQILYLALDDLKLNLALSLGYAAGYLYSYTLPPRWRPLTIYLVSALATIVSVFYFFRWKQDMSMYGNLLGIVAGILMVLLSFQAFSTNGHRFILMLCVVLLLFGAVASYDLKFMLLLPLFLLFAGCALYTANQVDVHARASGRDDFVPSGPVLSRQFMRVLVRSILVVLGLSIFAYTVAPHSSAAPRGLVINKISQVTEPEETEPEVQQPQSTVENQVVGLGDKFDLAEGGELSANPKPVLRVKTHRKPYLRAQVYDAFTARGWEKSAIFHSGDDTGRTLYDLQDGFNPFSPDGDSGRYFVVPLVDFPSQTTYQELRKTWRVQPAPNNTYSINYQEELDLVLNQQQITLLEDQPPFYFASFQPIRLSGISRRPNGSLLDTPLVDRASTVRARSLRHKHPKGFSYTVESLEPSISPKRLKEVYSAGPEQIVDHYTWLPLATEDWRQEAQERGLDPLAIRPISKKLINFAQTKFGAPKVVGGKTVFPSIGDKTQAIRDWLAESGEFVYDRSYPDLPASVEVTEGFIFTTQAGYCRHFSSAMAVLCRLNGIGARVVSGYAPGNYSLADNAYIYRQSDAHAWVEVYFDGFGWVMFDPTPTSSLQVDKPASLQFLASVVDFLQELFVIDPSRTQKMILEQLALLWTFIKTNSLLAGGIGGGLVCLAVLILLLRLRKKRRTVVTAVPRNAAVEAYLRVVDALRDLGFILETGDTARMVFATAGQHFPALATPLEGLLPLYERGAFAPVEPVAPEAELARAYADDVRRTVDAVLEQRRAAKHRRRR